MSVAGPPSRVQAPAAAPVRPPPAAPVGTPPDEAFALIKQPDRQRHRLAAAAGPQEVVR
jgi:hypothetical protein